MRAGWLGLACFAVLLGPVSASAKFSAAEATGTAKPECTGGSFSDPRNGGECWKCPSGFGRTVFFPVDSDKACVKPLVKTYKEAAYKGKDGCDEDAGEFFDPRKGGQCWKCPKGKPRRTLHAVTSDRACATKAIIGEKLGSAKYKHKAKGCKAGQFSYDDKCYACPSGYARVLGAKPTSSKACEKLADDYEPATQISSTCPKGSFLDPNGKCYACKAPNDIRTIYPVTGNKACASSLTEAFVPDVGALKSSCEQVVDALKAALDKTKDAQDKLADAVKPYVDPIRKPLEKSVGGAVEKISSKARVGDLVDEVEDELDDFSDDALGFAKTANDKQQQIRAMLLDKSFICSGNVPKMIARMSADLGTKASSHFYSIGVSASFKHPQYVPRMNFGIAFVTNLGKKGGVFLTAGLGADASIGATGLAPDPSPLIISLSAAFHPKAELADFGLSAVPGMNFGLAKGGAWDSAVGKFPGLKALGAVDAVEISWDFDEDHYPALGVSKDLYVAPPDSTQGLFAVSGSVDWGVPLYVYDN